MVSVIIPVYNVEKYLGRCIESVLNQTYKNLEIILINDGSQDSSGNICDKYAKKDERIRVIHKENGGLSSARNKGLDVARGDYIVFVDSDDYIEPNMVEFLRKTLIQNNVEMVICAFSIVSARRLIKTIGEDAKEGVYQADQLYLPYTYFLDGKTDKVSSYNDVVWNKMYKRNIFDGLRFVLGKIHEDVYIMHYVIERCKTIYVSNRPLYNYWYNENSITNSKISLSRLDVVEAFIDRIDFFDKLNKPERISFYLYSAINTYTNLHIKIRDKNEKEKQRFRELREAILDRYNRHKKKMQLKQKICASVFKNVFSAYVFIRKKLGVK